MTDEYFEGRMAFMQGWSEDDNPYNEDVGYTKESIAYWEWQSGWYSAEADSKGGNNAY